jgi:outer membrane protein
MARRFALAGLIAVAVVAAPTADAQQGELRVGGRLVRMETDTTTDVVLDTGSVIAFDTTWSLDFDITWMAGHDWGLEWMVTTAPNNLCVFGGEYAGLDVGDVWIAESTLTLQYYIPMWGRWRPYIGLGAGFGIFHNADTTDDAQQIGVHDITSDLGVGVAAQAGLSHRLDEAWVVSLDIKYIDLPIDVRLKGPDGATRDRLEADLDPLIIGLGAAIRF